jgi:hypothetical protein
MAAFATKSYGMIQQSPSGYRSVVGIRFTVSTFGQGLSKVAKYVKSLGERMGGRCKKVRGVIQ